MSVKVTFLGATQTVTGSKTLLDGAGVKILIDCGLYQGSKSDEDQNWSSFPVDPATIDYLILTHAHLDHSGYIPKLVRDGFTGKILTTAHTRKLATIVLRDSAFLQMEDARYAAKKGYSKHRDPQPLYTSEDVEKSLPLFSDAAFDFPIKLNDQLTVTFFRAGHILGSAFISLQIENKHLLFSGDLGRPNHPILTPPEPIGAQKYDLVVVESTYGDRKHETSKDAFEKALVAAINRGGSILIPAFAVDRTEVILMALHKLISDKKIPSLPIYVDSPMALSALKFYREAIDQKSIEIKSEICEIFLSQDPFNPGNLKEISTVDQSKALNDISETSIIISASGMATGGRVVHHLANMLPNPANTVILVGYQANGSRGQILAQGAKEIRIHGEEVKVRAAVEQVQTFSVHGDAQEVIAWLSTMQVAPGVVYVNHGENTSANSLVERIKKEKGWQALRPLQNKPILL
jgi:metallo-beta-lactamase family protein